MRRAGPGRAEVRVTRNFERNLDEIEAFLDADARFDAVLELLKGRLLPLLERVPQAGRDFLRIPPTSDRAMELMDRIGDRLPRRASVRQVVLDDYLILYLERPGRVDLLAIRHHRQLSYDLDLIWWR